MSAPGPRWRRPTVDYRTVAVVAAMSALPFLFLMPLFGAPFERDQGAYATIAEGWTNGAIPYRDLWDNKGPVLFLWYMLSFAWLGETTLAPRVMAGIVAGLCVPFVWATANTLFGRREATLAAGFFAVAFANVYLQVTANAAVFMLLPMTAGMWAFSVAARATRSGKEQWFLAAGILTSLAVLTRQSAVWAFIGYSGWLGALAFIRPWERPRHLAAIILLAVGGLIGALPFIVYFAANGALYEFWHAMFGFNFGWAARQSFWMKLVPPLIADPGHLAGGLVFWVLAGAGVWQLWKRNTRTAWLVLVSAAAAEAAAQTMGKASAHYSIQLLPAASIAAGFGMPGVIGWWQKGNRAFRAGLAFSVLVTLVAVAFAYTRPTPAQRFEAQYSFRSYADDAVEAPEIAEAVKAMAAPEECVYEWGRSSQIYFLADREPCSRWIHDRPYEVDRSVIQEVMADLAAREPAVILVTSGGEPPPLELVSLISQRYRYAGQVEYAQLFRRIRG